MSRFEGPRNVTKAIVRRDRRDGVEVVIKDYTTRPWWVRALFGRPTLRREAKVYARLAGVRGIPACFGFEGRDALVLALAPGDPLDTLDPSRVSPAAFDALDRVVAAVHARGVAIADLHRSNVLVTPDADVNVIDFAIARIARDPAHPGWLVRQLMQLDRHAAARLRARTLGLPEPQAEGMFGAVYRTGRRLKRVLR